MILFNQPLDRWALVIIFVACSLLWLPAFILDSLFYWGGIGLIVTIILLWVNKGYKFLFLLLGIIFLIYGQAFYLLQQAQNIVNLPTKINSTFKITEILHQQDYQRLVIETQLTDSSSVQRIYTHWQAESKPKIGEIWQGELLLRPLSSRLNQQGFDRQQWAFAKKITLQARVKSAVKIGEDFTWREKRLNQAIAQVEDLTEGGLLLALAFGERAWLKGETWKLYQQTNTAHLIAISGLHIGIAMGIGFSLCRLLQFCFPTFYINRYFPLLGGMVVAWLYAELAGFSIPTFRAIVALFILLVFQLSRGYCTAWQLFIRVIAILLIFDPFMPLSASFWLSIGAVACLILWYQLFPLWLFEWKGVSLAQNSARYFIGLLHLQFGLLWLFTPIQLAIFQGFSLYSFFANLLVVPVYSLLLVPLVLFATLTEGALASWYWANELILLINQGLLYGQNGWVAVAQKTSLFYTALLCLFLMIAVYVIYQFSWQRANNSPFLKTTPSLFSLSMDRYLSLRVQQYLYIAGTIFISYCLIQWGYYQFFTPKWRLETLDVGQGQATLLVKNNQAILYDTGASWQGGDMASIEIIPYLRRQGIVLEQLVVSHDDNDHAGGVASLLAEFPQVTLIYPSKIDYQAQHILSCEQGKHWQWQGLTIKVLSPSHKVERANNTDSCVLLIDDGHYRILLTGDADIQAERRFIHQLIEPIDILQVGHHGSKTSTSELLLANIKPKVALISRGRWNPWHLPNKQVVERLQRYQAQIFDTAIEGQISILFYGDSMKMKTARDKFSPWYSIIIGESGK